MSDDTSPHEPESAESDVSDERVGSGDSADAEWQRRRRLAAVFGDVLPETTSDERDVESPDDDATDTWLRSQVPPHHG